jgi:hypothetical protein
MLDPSENRRVRHNNAAFAHHGHQIAVAQLVAEIPTNAQHHDLLVEVPTFEQILDRSESWRLSIIANLVFAPEPCRLHRHLDRSRARETAGAVDSKEDFVQMPVVAEPTLSSLQFANIICAKLLTPQPDGFVSYDDAAFR